MKGFVEEPALEIRGLRLADYDAVHALWRDAAGVQLRAADDSREGLEKFLLRNPATNYVAAVCGDVVGAILCGHDGRRGCIYHAVVRLEYRNRGIGRALVERALAALRREGVNKAALLVMRGNDAGNAFWEKVGFALRQDVCYRDLPL